MDNGAGITPVMPIGGNGIDSFGGDSSITAVLIAGAGVVNNISMRVIKQ